jgi:hypothetical protein
MKTILLSLSNQLNNYPTLEYAKKSNYIAEDPYELMGRNLYPFFNLMPGDERIEPLEEMSENEFERHIFPVSIQFATRSLKINIALLGDDNHIGLLDFSRDIQEAIKFDKTLNYTVDGILPGSSIPKDTLKDNNLFIARGEITIEFYRDIVNQ